MSTDKMSFIEAMSLAECGLEIWKAKEHNAKWWRKIDGTPIPNDLLVNIAEEFAKCGLVYASDVDDLRSQLVKAKEALHHANTDMSMLLPEIANRDMQKSFRKTLDMIDAIGASND